MPVLMNKALFVGINNYAIYNPLKGCCNDAVILSDLIKDHADGRPNFETITLTAPDSDNRLTRSTVVTAIENLFRGDCNVALFYFSGHGLFDEVVEEGCILTSDYKPTFMEGIRVSDIIHMAESAKGIKHKIIILDCCQSGAAGDNRAFKSGCSAISDGMTILTACKKDEYALDGVMHGMFTALIIDALKGGASNVLGQITPAGIYSFVDNALGLFEQRPVFKTNVSGFVVLREVQPHVEKEILRKLPDWFPEASAIFPLDPSFEFTQPNANDDNVAIFKQLQKCNRNGLIAPVNAEHMYFAALESTGCRLTALGAYYRDLAAKRRL